MQPIRLLRQIMRPTTRSENHADLPLFVHAHMRGFYSRMHERLGSGGNREWHRPRHMFTLPLVHPRKFVEPGDLTRDTNGKVARIESRHLLDAARSRERGAAECLHTNTIRA